MKAAATPAQATMTPPTAGPKLRAMLKLTLFNAIALGSSAGVTCSPTDACHEGPNRAIPLPTRKVNRRRLAGPTWPPNTAIDKRRTEEHTSELQSLMRISYAVFCLKKKNNKQTHTTPILHTYHYVKKNCTQYLV